LRDGGSIVVQIRVSAGIRERVPALRVAGAEIFDVSSEYETATASVNEGGPATFKVRLGKHTLVISATDAAGNVAKTTYKWRVKKR